MKRFHVHVGVEDLAASIRFYSTVFSAEPAVIKPDYAKWMLEDPRVNFAISQRGALGVDHLGLQVDNGEELAAMRTQLETADAAMTAEINTTCCYAQGDKYWVTDPSGIAWETFHTLANAPTFGRDRNEVEAPNACCAPSIVPTEHTTTACGPAATGCC